MRTQKSSHKPLSKQDLTKFQTHIWDFYTKNRRDFPWRNTITPYSVFISEVMLQQTQTNRIIEKYHEFLQTFPDFQSLATTPFEKLLRVWKGLGYNRRALYLQKSAQIIISEFKENLTKDVEKIDSLPGIGKATAASILVFAYNIPLVFIETNIRRVFIHEFFQDIEEVHDNKIFPLIEQTLDTKNPREWYYALMDYGAFLGKHPPAGGINPNRKSKHYTKQSKFEGSLRQIRGKILEILLDKKSITPIELENHFLEKKELFQKAYAQLQIEGFIEVAKNKISLKQ